MTEAPPAQRCLAGRYHGGDAIMIFAGADDLRDRIEMPVKGWDQGRRRLNGMDFEVDVIAGAIADQPRASGEYPDAGDAVLFQQGDRVPRRIGRQQFLLYRRQIGIDDRAPIIAAERQSEPQRFDQHALAEGRPAAADREMNPSLAQPSDGRDRARCQRLVGSDQRAVDIRDDERDFSHAGLLGGGVKTSIPVAEATTTTELRPTNSPLSTVPTVIAIRASSAAESRIGPNRQSRMKLPPSVT
jgi:hypothetical protein